MKITINSIVAVILTAFSWVFGEWDVALKVLMYLMLIDYATGVLKGFVKRELSSEIGRKGIARKASTLIVLSVGVLVDRLLNNGQWIFRTLICYFYISNEGISLLENCAQLGAPIPPQLIDALKQLKEGQRKELH